MMIITIVIVTPVMTVLVHNTNKGGHVYKHIYIYIYTSIIILSSLSLLVLIHVYIHIYIYIYQGAHDNHLRLLVGPLGRGRGLRASIVKLIVV